MSRDGINKYSIKKSIIDDSVKTNGYIKTTYYPTYNRYNVNNYTYYNYIMYINIDELYRLLTKIKITKKHLHPLKPWKDSESLYCDTEFLEKIFNKKLK